MKTIDMIIRKKRRVQYYNYYKHLGYDQKTAACAEQKDPERNAQNRQGDSSKTG